MARSGGTWVKGQSGNPAGRPPKGQSFAELLHEFGEQAHAKGGTYRERLVRMAWEQAAMGDHAARAWIVERIDGRVATTVLEAQVAELEALVAELLQARTGAAPGNGYRVLAESN